MKKKKKDLILSNIVGIIIWAFIIISIWIMNERFSEFEYILLLIVSYIGFNLAGSRPFYDGENKR